MHRFIRASVRHTSPRRLANALSPILTLALSALTACNTAPPLTLDELGVANTATVTPSDHPTTTGAQLAWMDAPDRPARARTFAAIAGWNEGTWWIDETIAPTPADTAWKLTRSTREATDPPRFATPVAERTFETDPDGTVFLRRLVDLEDHREVRFTPPITVLPPEITPGLTIQNSARAEVKDAQTGQTIGSGNATSTVTINAVRAVARLDAEPIPAYEIENTIIISLGVGTITKRSTAWYHHRQGKLAARESLRITTFGIGRPAEVKGLRRATLGAQLNDDLTTTPDRR